MNSKTIATITIFMVLFSCTGVDDINNDTDNSILNKEYQTYYDECAFNFASALNGALNENIDLRRIVKAETEKKFDGDYDLLVVDLCKHKMNIDHNVRTKSGLGETSSVKDLLNVYYHSKFPETKSQNDPIGTLVDNYPTLQVSIPSNIDRWDESVTPTIAVIPSDYEDLVTDSVIGIAEDGSLVEVDALNEPSDPVIVVSNSERVKNVISPSLDTVKYNPIIGGVVHPVISQPSPVSNLSVVSRYGTSNVITWDAPDSKYPSYIYRTTPSESEKLLAVVQSDTYRFTDSNVVPGEKYFYMVKRYDISTQKFSAERETYIYNPYRNPDSVSKVMLKRIHVNASEVEGWLLGCPEFYVSICGLDTELNLVKLGTTVDVAFKDDKNDSQPLNALLHNWSYFNDATLYPVLNFNMIEYDAFKGSITIKADAKAGIKYEDYISIETIAQFEYKYEDKDKNCGTGTLAYFEDPETVITLQNYDAYLVLSEEDANN